VVSATLHADVEQAVRTLVRVVHDARPGTISGDEARRLVELFARAEKAASSGIALLSPVVVQTGSYAKVGHASAPEWLAAVSGTSTGAAKGRLASAERAAADPLLSGAIHEAELSAPQLKLLADARAVDPEAPAALLALIGEQASNQEVSDALARLRNWAHSKESARARRARVHAQRYFRWHQVQGGGIRSEIFCDEVAWARVAPDIEAEAKARWQAAGAGAQERESFEAYRLDAFLDLISGARGRSAARPRAIVIVDAQALRRGSVSGGETCEIDGIGPVSVEAATELLGEAAVQFIIKDGLDITTVTSSTRYANIRTQAALLIRDRVCAVPGCGKRHGLEDDHCAQFAHGGATTLANLVRLCGPHHAMKTYGGWKLVGRPGQRSWIPPERPPSAGFIIRSAKVAKAKASGRNLPRTT
jgi:hypothetical protein